MTDCITPTVLLRAAYTPTPVAFTGKPEVRVVITIAADKVSPPARD